MNIVTGDGPSAGEPLVLHPDVPVISFTGSVATGTHVATLGAQHRKRVALELGGKNPIIVMEDADLDLVLNGVLWGAFGTTGQRCTATSRLIVQRSILDELTTRLLAQVQTLVVGNGLQPGVQVGPVINQQQLETISRYVAIGQAEGAELLIGGKQLTEPPYAKGYFFAPTVFGGVRRTMRIAQEEIFGPVLCIIAVDDFDEAIDVANDVPYGLSASIYTRDVNRAFRAMRDLDTGIVYINAPTIGAEVHLPFGGTGATGNGHRESGTATFDVFTEWKSIYIDYSGRLQRAQID